MSWKRIIQFFLLLFIIVVVIIITCNLLVVNNSKGKIYSDVNEITPRQFGLLLGTSPHTRYGGKSNSFFKYRIDAAEKLYKEGKIDYLLISGDENSLNGINEPQCMKDSLVARGIPEENIFLDGKGFRTFDSVKRANKVYGLSTFTVISQEFHNERTLYLAEHLDLDLYDLQAFNAQSPTSKLSLITDLREYLARVKLFVDILINNAPEEYEEMQNLTSLVFEREEASFMQAINTIDAHEEQDTIIGNFTGKGNDTLYVVKEENLERYMATAYYMVSTNPEIPRIEIHGIPLAPPKLVNEGDLDGNGTTDVGYLHTWINGQWRTYQILTLVDNKWRNLVDGEYLLTPQSFRDLSVQVAEPGPKKGTVLIHYYYETYDDEKDWRDFEIRDTIVCPTFSSITNDM